MMYGWHDGAWGIVWMIASFGVIITLVWVAVRAFTRDDMRQQHPRDAKDVLAERFAKGEIDADEYGERLRVLEGHDTAKPTR